RAGVASPPPPVARARTASCARAKVPRARTAAAATAAKVGAVRPAARPPRPTVTFNPKGLPAMLRPASHAAKGSPATAPAAATPLHAEKTIEVPQVARRIAAPVLALPPAIPAARGDPRLGRWHPKGRGRRPIRRACAARATRRRVRPPPRAAFRCQFREAAAWWLCVREIAYCRSQASIAAPPVSANSPRR